MKEHDSTVVTKREISKETSKYRKIELVLVWIFCAIAYSPTFYYYIQGDYYRGIESPGYVNGLVSASGILLGFLSATAISKSDKLDQFHFELISVCFGSFILAIVTYSTAIIKGTLTVFEITLIQANIILSSASTYAILRKIFSEKLP